MYNGINRLQDDSKVRIYINGFLDYIGLWKDFKFKDYLVTKDVLRLAVTETSDFVVIGYYKDL